jgi:hypothetical protein
MGKGLMLIGLILLAISVSLFAFCVNYDLAMILLIIGLLIFGIGFLIGD